MCHRDMGNEGNRYANTIERTERMMIRWMCGVKLRDRNTNAELLSRLGIESVSGVVRRGRLRWFGHAERKEPDDWVSAWCIVVENVKGRGHGRPMKTWRQCIDEDMAKLIIIIIIKCIC